MDFGVFVPVSDLELPRSGACFREKSNDAFVMKMFDTIVQLFLCFSFIFFPLISTSSEIQPEEIPVEEQPIKPSPAVIIKPPVLFRKPTQATKPTTPLAKPPAPAIRPTVPATKAHLPVIKLPVAPTETNASIPLSTAAATQVSATAVKSSPAMNQERWDEDAFDGLWDASEDKRIKSGYGFCGSEISSTVPTSLSSGIPPFPKPPVIQQTVDYGHGHSHGQGEC